MPIQHEWLYLRAERHHRALGGEDGQGVEAGEILVIPAQQRVRIETDGQITLGEHLVPPKYTTSIDDVLRDTAIQWAREVAGELLNARRAGIEAIVRDELEKLSS